MKRTINFDAEVEFIDSYDEWYKKKGYATRTQAITTAMREQMEDSQLRRNIE